MASAFGHAAVAITGSRFFKETPGWKIIGLGIVCSILPDADVLSFNFGIPYTHWLGHRGVTHSILFALIFSALTALVFKGKNKFGIIFLYLFFCTVSHGILDGMTTGGRGVGYFIPFDLERYFLPWRKILVSPLGIENFFSQWGARVILSEIIWIGIPCLFLWIINYFIRVNKKAHKTR